MVAQTEQKKISRRKFIIGSSALAATVVGGYFGINGIINFFKYSQVDIEELIKNTQSYENMKITTHGFLEYIETTDLGEFSALYYRSRYNLHTKPNKESEFFPVYEERNWQNDPILPIPTSGNNSFFDQITEIKGTVEKKLIQNGYLFYINASHFGQVVDL